MAAVTVETGAATAAAATAAAANTGQQQQQQQQTLVSNSIACDRLVCLLLALLTASQGGVRRILGLHAQHLTGGAQVIK